MATTVAEFGPAPLLPEGQAVAAVPEKPRRPKAPSSLDVWIAYDQDKKRAG